MIRLRLRTAIFALLPALPLAPNALAQELAPAASAAVAPVLPVPTAVSHYVPQTAHERWHGYLHETLLGTMPAVRLFGSALIDHIGGQGREWGFSTSGYAHRLRNRAYSTAIDGSVHASLAALLHQDTRYLRAEGRGTMGRVGHAFYRTLFTYNPSGGRVFDVSGLAGIYAGTMIPMYWHPSRYSPLAQGVRAGNFGVMFQTGSNLFKEFQPDLKRLLRKDHSNSLAVDKRR